MDNNLHLGTVRPMVRYVDEEQAVIDAYLTALPWLPTEPHDPLTDVLVQINGDDGFHDEGETPLRLVGGEGSVRFEVVHPQRWWPAGMGRQPLYELTVTLARGDEVLDNRQVTLGLTSVRRQRDEPALLVNGRLYEMHALLPVDRIDEHQLLPATGDTLLLVRDHYGPDVLYQAADRAGILLIQCIPIHPQGKPEVDVAAQVNRLAWHPSLAGWFVGHLGRLSDEVAAQLRALDPTHGVFRDLPMVTS